MGDIIKLDDKRKKKKQAKAEETQQTYNRLEDIFERIQEFNADRKRQQELERKKTNKQVKRQYNIRDIEE